jgi:membrane protein implicated in regulation of membrane protease activity
VLGPYCCQWKFVLPALQALVLPASAALAVAVAATLKVHRNRSLAAKRGEQGMQGERGTVVEGSMQNEKRH